MILTRESAQVKTIFEYAGLFLKTAHEGLANDLAYRNCGQSFDDRIAAFDVLKYYASE